MRVIPERITQLLEKSHTLLVPTFLLISDICSVGDEELNQVRAALKAVVDKMGTNQVSVGESGG